MGTAYVVPLKIRNMPFPLIPVIAAGASLAGAGINAASTSANNRAGREFSWQMYKRQRQDALTDRNFALFYDSPAEQMKRLKAAGMNPYLVHGQGVNNAPPVRSADAPSWRPEAPQVNLGEAVMGYADASLKEAQTNNVNAATEVQKQEAILKQLTADLTLAQKRKLGVDTEAAEFNLQTARAMQPLSLEGAALHNAKTQEEINKVKADISYTQQQQILTALQSSSSLKEAAARVLSMQIHNAKTEADRKVAEQSLKNLQQDEKLKAYEVRLSEMNISKHDNIAVRAVANLLNKVKGKNDKTPQDRELQRKMVRPLPIWKGKN